jgi:tellurite resistance protein TerC
MTALLAGVPIWIWGTFLLFVLAMLALDLGVFHRRAHEIKMKEALTWSAIWIAMALVFNLLLYFYWDFIAPGSNYTPSQAGMAYLAGYVIEKALSVDNIFVFLLVFTYFGVPARYQHRVLFWGILGALFFRASFIAAGSALLANFAWMMLVFGAFLFVTGIKMVAMKDKEMQPGKNPVLLLFKRFVPVTSSFHGQKFLVRIDGKLWATPLLLTLVFVEFTDIIFAVDSIPAIFAITREPFIVFTSNVFAILGLRALYFAVASLVRMFHYLSYGLAAILIFVGAKMCWNYVRQLTDPEYHFPISISLAVIIGVLTVSILASIVRPPKEEDLPELPADAHPEDEDVPEPVGK